MIDRFPSGGDGLPDQRHRQTRHQQNGDPDRECNRVELDAPEHQADQAQKEQLLGDAEYHDGLLTLRIPLSQSAKPRRIDIRHHEAPEQAAITVDST